MVMRGPEGVSDVRASPPAAAIPIPQVSRLSGRVDFHSGAVEVAADPGISKASNGNGVDVWLLGRLFGASADDVLTAFERKGISGLDAFDGAAVVAIWETNRRTIHLARHPSAETPIFHRSNGPTFEFSTRLFDLIRPGDTLDPLTAVQFLRCGTTLSPRTLVEQVRRVPAREAVSVNIEGRDVVSLWEPWQLEITDPPLAERVESLGSLLEDLITPWLGRDPSPAILMSGGIDSVGLAAAITRHPVDVELTAYTLTFDEEVGDIDEFQQAAAVAQHLGIQHRPIRFTHEHIADHLDWMLEAYEEPFGYSLHSSLLTPIAEAGHDVVFGGTGPDIYYPKRSQLRWKKLLDLVPESAHGSVGNLVGHFGAIRGTKGLANAFERSAAAPEDRLATSAGPNTQPDMLERLGVTRDLIESSAAAGASHIRPRLAGVSPSTKNTRLLFGWAIWNHADQGAGWMQRWMHMYGLTAALPLTNPRMGRFLLGLDPLLPKRAEFRELALRSLPRDLAYNPKIGQDVPLAGWLRGPLHDLASERLSDAGILEGVLDPESVQTLFEEHVSEAKDHHWLIWKLITLITWKQHFDRMRSASGRS